MSLPEGAKAPTTSPLRPISVTRSAEQDPSSSRRPCPDSPRAAAQAAAQARLALLAEGSQVFAEGGLDLDAVIERISRYLAERVGDACGVRLTSADGEEIDRGGSAEAL